MDFKLIKDAVAKQFNAIKGPLRAPDFLQRTGLGRLLFERRISVQAANNVLQEYQWLVSQ